MYFHYIFFYPCYKYYFEYYLNNKLHIRLNNLPSYPPCTVLPSSFLPQKWFLLQRKDRQSIQSKRQVQKLKKELGRGTNNNTNTSNNIIASTSLSNHTNKSKYTFLRREKRAAIGLRNSSPIKNPLIKVPITFPIALPMKMSDVPKDTFFSLEISVTIVFVTFSRPSETPWIKRMKRAR